MYIYVLIYLYLKGSLHEVALKAAVSELCFRFYPCVLILFVQIHPNRCRVHQQGGNAACAQRRAGTGCICIYTFG